MKTFFGLPKEVKFCSKCVISNQRPNSSVEFKNKSQKKTGIQFDKNNICSACNYHEVKKKLIGIKEIKCSKNFYQNTEKRAVMM